MSSKRQQTMAKMARERTVRERRERKLEKKQAAAAERKLRAAGLLPPLGEEPTEFPESDLVPSSTDAEPLEPADQLAPAEQVASPER
jgi:hypothetical protein